MSFIKTKIIGANIPYEVYSRQEPDVKRGHKDFIMSRGELVNFASCPKRWLDGYKEEQDSTASTDWGSMIDCLLTSPESFAANFSVTPEMYQDTKTGESKPWNGNATFCKQWKKEQGGRTIIKSDIRDEAALAVLAIRENPVISELFKISDKQVFVAGFWLDGATNIEIPIRILLDLVPPLGYPTFGKWLADFKTARNGDPANWASVIDKQSYDVQAALYLDLYVAATGQERIDFVHVVQENVFPFHVTNPPPAMSAEFLDWGRAKYRKAFSFYAQCLATGQWPSYPQTGFQFGATRIIGPDDLYSYRQCAGMTEFRTPEQKREQPSAETVDLTP